MIDAIIFDLDGTLVQTERLKAISYALAAHELDPTIDQTEVLEAFKEVVGLSRAEVAQSLMDRFGLQPSARDRMTDFGVSSPWQAYVQMRLKIYAELLSDPDVLRRHRWRHTLELLERSRELKCRLGLATMSSCQQARRVLEALGLDAAFDFVASRDDVERGKPDPEIYQLTARELGARPNHTLVIEDSVPGVEAALGAGMQVVAVATPFTRRSLHESGLLDENQIVDDPALLMNVVERVAGQMD